jgi:hypothetical protein
MNSSAQPGPVWIYVEYCRVMCPSTTQATLPSCQSHFRLSLLAAFPRDGPGRSTPRRFHCSHICKKQMPDDVLEQYTLTCIYFPISSLFLVEHSSDIYLVLIVSIFFRLINQDNRIKISACILHISLATFATFAIFRVV